MADPEQARWVFDVDRQGPEESDGESGRWYLTCEPHGGDLSALEDGVLAFRLMPSAGEDDARELEHLLNELVDFVSFTDVSDIPGG